MTATATKNAKAESASNPWFRETLDSFGVALILAFLFRAFIAEAFVIPTGSMAPTLMGAHKDVTCSQCGFGYQSGASEEFNNETGGSGLNAVYETTCPICRFQQPIEMATDSNQKTFSGDRILVSKLAYIQGDPQRWQVIVFKNPTQARQNYIKRLVGIPNEVIHIEHGNVYTKKNGDSAFSIARKPAHIAAELLQPVNDTNHRASLLIDAGIPSPWQPDGPIPGTKFKPISTSAWNVTNSKESWSAELKTSSTVAAESEQINDYDWLRYYHNPMKPWQWYELIEKGKLTTEIAPRSSDLIADFSHYNASVSSDRSVLYAGAARSKNWSVRDDITFDREPIGLFVRPESSKINDRPYGRIEASTKQDGLHWVGDLACEFDVELASNEGIIAVDLVEAGTHYLLQYNVADGSIQLRAILENQSQAVFEANDGEPVKIATASTNVKGGSSVRIKYANIDDTLHVWLNDDLVEFTPSSRVVSPDALNLKEHRPRFSNTDSADAAPVGIAFSNGLTGKVTRARVYRDIYYTAVDNRVYRSPELRGELTDYPNLIGGLRASISEKNYEAFTKSLPPNVSERYLRDEYGNTQLLRDIFFSNPELWESSPLFESRGYVEFTMKEDQYLPMGDNSAKSLDGRLWGDEHFVHRDLLIGRAVLVFWPHHWNKPIPFWPNFQRFGIIR